MPSVQFIDAAGTFAPNEHAERRTSPILERLSDDRPAAVLPRHGRRPRASTSRRPTCSARARWRCGCRATARRRRRSARPVRREPQDHIFPSYREHVVAHDPRRRPHRHRRLLRGTTPRRLGPERPTNGNFHLLHARARLADPARDRLRDGHATRRRRRHRRPRRRHGRDRLLRRRRDQPGRRQRGVRLRRELPDARRCSSCRTTSGPSRSPSRASRARRSTCAPRGFGIPSVQIDGNDVLASYAVDGQAPRRRPRRPRPQLHRGADLPHRRPHHDPTTPRSTATTTSSQSWIARDPIVRFEAYLQSARRGRRVLRRGRRRGRATSPTDIRRRTLALRSRPIDDSCSTTSTPSRTRSWPSRRPGSRRYEASFGGGNA